MYKEIKGRAEDGGRRTEDGGRRTEGRGRRAEDGGRSAEGGGRGAERGWDSVVVEAADVSACQGFLPERHIGVNSGTLVQTTTDNCGGSDPVRLPPSAACGGTSPTSEEECEDDCGDTSPTSGEECQNATNEPKISDDVLSLQYKDSVEVTADLGGESGLDTIRTNPRRSDGWEDGGRGLEPGLSRRENEIELRGAAAGRSCWGMRHRA